MKWSLTDGNAQDDTAYCWICMHHMTRQQVRWELRASVYFAYAGRTSETVVTGYIHKIQDRMPLKPWMLKNSVLDILEIKPS